MSHPMSIFLLSLTNIEEKRWRVKKKIKSDRYKVKLHLWLYQSSTL